MTTTLNDAYATPIQAQAFSLLAIDPTKLQPITDSAQR
jgi:hypothetical protein